VPLDSQAIQAAVLATLEQNKIKEGVKLKKVAGKSRNYEHARARSQLAR